MKLEAIKQSQDNEGDQGELITKSYAEAMSLKESKSGSPGIPKTEWKDAISDIDKLQSIEQSIISQGAIDTQRMLHENDSP